jgi:ribose 5-phosphate isomerase B
MKIAIGCDHRGFHLKAKLIEMLTAMGHEMVDEGTHHGRSVDYPDFASAVSRKVSCGEADRGILICGTGIGMSIVANKFRGVRAATCRDEPTAEISRRHNDANVLCLSGDMVGEQSLGRLVSVWMNTQFEGGRHARRLTKIAQIEQEHRPCPDR